MKEYEARQSKTTKSKAAKTGLGGSRPVDIDKEPLQLQHHFRIYFPTEKTVSSSRGGRSVSCVPAGIAALPVDPAAQVPMYFPRMLILRDLVCRHHLHAREMVEFFNVSARIDARLPKRQRWPVAT